MFLDAAAAETATNNSVLRAGTNFIPTRVFSADDDQKVLKAFEGLRVADVCDGMDAMGLHGRGLMDADIHPLWRDTVNYTHRFIGIAVTARYVPTQAPTAGQRSTEDYDRWAGNWYGARSSEPFVPLLRPGTALVLEDTAEADVGSIGSNNIMSWKLKGCVGVVTSATARDTDEIVTEKVPLYSVTRAAASDRAGMKSSPSIVPSPWAACSSNRRCDRGRRRCVIVVPRDRRWRWRPTPAKSSKATRKAAAVSTKSSGSPRIHP